MRHVKQANSDLFARLDAFCATREDALVNAGRARWIASAPAHKHFMRNAALTALLNTSSVMKIARFDLPSKTYFFTSGFDVFTPPTGAVEIDVSAAHLTVALAEMRCRPSVSTSTIRDVVEIGDLNSDPTYRGHDPSEIARLYPTLRVFQHDRLPDAETWKVFFQLCVSEASLGESWLSAPLVKDLEALADLDPRRIPYRLLCRSIFSGEATYFFLALYRCVEALYSFSSADKLRKALGLGVGWDQLAAGLEDELGWHPREEGSLESLLRMASEKDLRLALEANNESTDGLDQEKLLRQATKRIYWVRNSIVHFRPSQQRIDLDRLDWNKLCRAMTGIVFSTYVDVFRA